MAKSIHFRRSVNLGWGTNSYMLNFSSSLGDTNYMISPEFDFDAGNWWIANKTEINVLINWSNTSWNNIANIEVYQETRDGG